MRDLSIFVAGILFGLVIQMAVAQGQKSGLVGLNHVAISVLDLDEAVTYYTETMGFPEAFRVVDEAGQVALIYVQVNASTFVELQPANERRPPGINHFGVQVEDMAVATATFRERGANVAETVVGGTNAILSSISDPNGIRIELLELPSDSLHAVAMGRWK